MKKLRLPAALLFALAAALSWVSSVRASIYNETGDAGDLPGTAQIIGTSIDTPDALSIRGALTFSSTTGTSDSDMFRIYISQPSLFSASMFFAPGINNFDSQLAIFNANGKGIVANDDDPANGNQQARIPAGALTGQTAGYYYLLISGSGRYAVDANSNLIFPNYTDGTTDPTGVYGPNAGAGAIAGYIGSSNEAGAYAVLVPEFSGAGWLAVGAAGLALAHRLRRQAPRG